MLLAYLDESYTADHYWIAALVAPEQDVLPLTTALDDVVARAAAAYRGVSEKAELHGHRLFHGSDDWSPLKEMPRARIAIYNDAFEAIGDSGAHIIIRGVDRKRLAARYVYPNHPHVVVLEHLLERINEKAAALGELSLVIADEVDQADNHRRNLWYAQRYATSGYRARSSSGSWTRSTLLRPAPAGFSRGRTSWPSCTAGSPQASRRTPGRSGPTPCSGGGWPAGSVTSGAGTLERTKAPLRRGLGRCGIPHCGSSCSPYCTHTL